jgi:hypothetical protein
MVIGNDDGHRPLRFLVSSHVSHGTPARATLTNRINGTVRLVWLINAPGRVDVPSVNPPFDIDRSIAAWRNQRLHSHVETGDSRLGDKSAATIKRAKKTSPNDLRAKIPLSTPARRLRR